eukprot:5010820-Pyramimonas_sp.AAC.1
MNSLWKLAIGLANEAAVEAASRAWALSLVGPEPKIDLWNVTVALVMRRARKALADFAAADP